MLLIHDVDRWYGVPTVNIMDEPVEVAGQLNLEASQFHLEVR